MTTSGKYSESDLRQLYEIAREQGWDALDQSERISLGRYCTRMGLKRPGQDRSAASKPEAPIVPVKDERTEDDLQLLGRVKLLDAFPDDSITGVRTTRYGAAAEALKRFGKPGVVAVGLSRKRAIELRRVIRLGKTVAWQPAGSFRAEAAPDHEHEGLFRVIAQYQGGNDGR